MSDTPYATEKEMMTALTDGLTFLFTDDHYISEEFMVGRYVRARKSKKGVIYTSVTTGCSEVFLVNGGVFSEECYRPLSELIALIRKVCSLNDRDDVDVWTEQSVRMARDVERALDTDRYVLYAMATNGDLPLCASGETSPSGFTSLFTRNTTHLMDAVTAADAVWRLLPQDTRARLRDRFTIRKKVQARKPVPAGLGLRRSARLARKETLKKARK